MPPPTRPDLIFGVNNRHPASVGTGTNSLGTVAYEEQSKGSPAGTGVGFGQLLGARQYENAPAAVYATGSDALSKFNGGRTIVYSVSGGYSCASVAAGTHDAEWNACFDRMFALGFGVSGKPQVAPLCYWHEVDRSVHGIIAADYIAAFKYLRTLRDARAVVAGVDASRVPLMTIYTAAGISSGAASAFWPGADQVDLFGVDGYSGLNGSGWREASAIFADPLSFAASHGNKDVWICETSVKEATGHNTTTWWSNFATLVANKPQIKAVYAFQGGPGDQTVNFDKSAFPNKHAGMLAFLATTGATATSGATGLVPRSPTPITVTATSNGTGLTVTKGAPPSGSATPTSYDVYIATGNVTSGFVKVNSTPLAYASSFSYTITGLVPGTTYTVTMAAANTAGRSGFGDMKAAATAVPGGTNQAPVITAGATSVDPSNPNTITMAVTAFDPEGNPVTYTHNITGPQGFTLALSGASVTHTFDNPGAYVDVVGVSDGALQTYLTLHFAVSAGETSTSNFNWPNFPPGMSPLDIPVLLRGIMPDIDDKLWSAYLAKSPANVAHGYVGSTFDPTTASATQKTAFVTADLRWYKIVVQDSTITGINTLVTDAQSGTGTVFCLHDSDGVPLCALQSGSGVDTPLQSVSPAGGTNIDLDTPIVGLIPGSIVYLGMLVGAATPFKTYLGIAQSTMGQLHQATGQWRGNSLGSQSTYPDVLPFSSGTAVTPAFFGLY